MALVRSRPGAYAQADTGGVPPSLLRIALLKSDAMKMAAQRTYGRQIEQGREGLSLSGMIFDKQADQRRQIAEKNLSLRRHMFDRNMQMQNERFEAHRPSDLEMAIGTVAPYAAGAYASYRDKKVTDEHMGRMEGQFAEQGINYKQDLLQMQLNYAQDGQPQTSMPRQVMQQEPIHGGRVTMGSQVPQNIMGQQMQYQAPLNAPLPQEEQWRPRLGGYR